jgi:hypothetical protein
MLFAALRGRIMIGALLIGTIIGLTTLAKRAPGPGDAKDAGAGINIRAELVDVWLPETLHRLAARDSKIPMPKSHEALRLRLNEEKTEETWYALTRLHFQQNGRVEEIRTIRYPCRSEADFESFLEVVDTIRKSPPSQADSSDSMPEVHVIREDRLRLGPLEAVRNLRSQLR